MQLSELYLDRYLYRDNDQSGETQGAAFMSTDSSDAEPFSIPSGGAAQDINTGNVLINGGQLEPGTYPTTTLDVSNWGWGQTCAFTSTDANTVSWTSGTFTSADGTPYSISSGNTGNMSAKTYIYLDLGTSETAYQTTTTSSESVGIGKVLIAVAEDDTTDATYNTTEANQVVADNILANTIDASKMNVGVLSAITANIGNITAGSLDAVTITGTTITGSVLQTGTVDFNVNIQEASIQIRDGSTVLGTWQEDGFGGGTAAFTTNATHVVVSNVSGYIVGDGTRLKIAQNTVPSSDGNYYLGDSSYGWGRLYLGTDGKYLENDGGTLEWNGSSLSGQNKIPSGGSSQQFLKYSSSGVPSWEYLGATANATSIVPSSGTANLGSTSYYWDNIYGGKLNLEPLTSNPSSGGDIVNYASGATDQFRGTPGDGTWDGSFDMSAY